MVLSRHDSNRVFPLSPLGDFGKLKDGPNPLDARDVIPKRSTSLCLRRSWRLCGSERCLEGAAEGREKLSSLDNLSIGISKKGFKTVDLLYAFVKNGRVCNGSGQSSVPGIRS